LPPRKTRRHLIGLIAGLAFTLMVAGALFVVSQRMRERPAADRARTAGVSRPPAAGAGPEAQRSKEDEAAHRINAANDLLNRGETEAAIRELQQAIALSPNDEDAHYNLGIALARAGREDDAIREYEAALRLFPDYAEVHNNYGNLLLRKGRVAEAIEHLDAAVKAMPDYALAHNNLGNALNQQGRPREALEHFKKAVQIQPDHWQARFNLGQVYLAQDQPAQAINELTEVLRVNPKFEPAERALHRAQERLAALPHAPALTGSTNAP
jgi:tetratricopeptide (TPR) repeat protein